MMILIRSLLLGMLVTSSACCKESLIRQSTLAQPTLKVSCADALDALITKGQDEGSLPPFIDEACWTSIKEKENLVAALISRVEKGDVTVATLFAPRVRDLDGGDLEDALRAYGAFAVANAEKLLTLVQSGALTTVQFDNALIMLPLDLSDDFNGQLKELEHRQAALSNVRNPAVKQQVAEGLRVIEAFRIEVKAAVARQSNGGD